MKDKVINALSNNRVKLDEVVKSLEPLTPSRYVALAKTSLELGRMYLGEVALDLGKEYPYEKTKEATKASEIEEAVDLSDTPLKLGDNEIQNIVNIRSIIDEINENSLIIILHFRKSNKLDNGKLRFVNDCNISQAYRSLKESRMWLGKRLGEIRDEGK